MKVFGRIIHFVCLLICCGGTSFAKRAAPSSVAAVRIGDLEFRATNSVECPGCVEVWNVKNHSRIDTIVVYKNRYQFWLERDVQWVFITKLEVHESEMLVVNERGDSYKVDLRTKRVTKIKSGRSKGVGPEWH